MVENDEYDGWKELERGEEESKLPATSREEMPSNR